MALDDRDWYREKPSEAWRAMFPGRSKPGMSPEPTRRPRRLRRSSRASVRGWVATLAIAGGIGVGFGAWQDHELPWQEADGGPGYPMASARLVSPSTSLRRPPTFHAEDAAKVVRLRPHRGLDTPTRHVTRWSITDRRFGRVSVYVPVGTTPREALTRALAAKGYQVLS